MAWEGNSFEGQDGVSDKARRCGLISAHTAQEMFSQ
jgi:hypothetical protein